MTLRRIQRGLEKLYRLDPSPDVRAFLVGEDAPARTAALRRPREQIFVGGNADELRLGVFVHADALANLERRDPARRLTDANLADLLLAVEAVSHFLCVIHCARARRPVRPIELELQAELDKYLVCLLLLEAQGGALDGLAARLADALRLADDLPPAERERYAAAAALSCAYAGALEDRFVRPRRLASLLDEVRRFYRLSIEAKRDRITAMAA